MDPFSLVVSSYKASVEIRSIFTDGLYNKLLVKTCASLYLICVCFLRVADKWGPHTHVSHRNLCPCKDMDRLAHQPLSLSHKPLSLLPPSLSLLLPLSPMEGDRPRHGWPSVAAWPWHDPGKWSSSAASGTLTRRPQAP